MKSFSIMAILGTRILVSYHMPDANTMPNAMSSDLPSPERSLYLVPKPNGSVHKRGYPDVEPQIL